MELVKELRAKLDLAGFSHVGIFVSGGFGIGSYITAASPIDFTADLHEVAGNPVAKRGVYPALRPTCVSPA